MKVMMGVHDYGITASDTFMTNNGGFKKGIKYAPRKIGDRVLWGKMKAIGTKTSMHSEMLRIKIRME